MSDVELPVLDLRRIDPTDWRRAISDEFDALPISHGFVLATDHAPRAILEGCRSECGEEVTWQPLELGPTDWRHQVTRLPLNEQTLAAVFERTHERARSLLRLLAERLSARDARAAVATLRELATHLGWHLTLESRHLLPRLAATARPGAEDTRTSEAAELDRLLDRLGSALATGARATTAEPTRLALGEALARQARYDAEVVLPRLATILSPEEDTALATAFLTSP